MELRIINQNILYSESEAIIFPIDGSRKGLEGNIAREYSKLHSKEWKIIEDSVNYPLGLGNVSTVQLNETNHKIVILASILNHIETIDTKTYERVVYNSFRDSLLEAKKHHIKTIATPLLSGGWRLDPLRAFVVMSNTLEFTLKSDDKILVYLCIKDKNMFNKISSLAKNLGW